MQSQKRALIVAHSVALLGVLAYKDIKTDKDGFKVNSGTASGGQDVQSLKSRIDQTKGGKPATITIKKADGQEITLLAAEAEVCFAQNMKALSDVNRGKVL